MRYIFEKSYYFYIVISHLIDNLRMHRKTAVWMDMLSYPLPILIKKVKKAVVKRVMPPAPETFQDNRFEPLSHITEKYFNLHELPVHHIDQNMAEQLKKNYLEHRFDLLGAGPVVVNYAGISLGLEGLFYLVDETIEEKIKAGKLDWTLPDIFRVNTEKLLKQLPPDYDKIDWHRDYKSGYRFDSAKTFDQSFGQLPQGVDLKCPWELTRLQHLPTLALLCKIFPNEKDRFVLEFKHQLIDHIAMNPAGIGVNWGCAMDVGIRAANILVGYDLIKDADDTKILDREFDLLLSTYLYEHGVFLYHHLEYGEGITSNHYLSNIGGLLFIAAYLQPTDEVMDWLYFSIQELQVETQKQFFAEGGNFEGSTSYHRLSTEILLYGGALLQGLTTERKKLLRVYQPKNRSHEPFLKTISLQHAKDRILEDDFFMKLLASVKFTSDILKANDEIPQYGDNDSGRFIKLFPQGFLIPTEQAIQTYEHLRGMHELYPHALYFDENILNHGGLISAAGGLLNQFSHTTYPSKYPLEFAFVQQLCKKQTIELSFSVSSQQTMQSMIPSLPFQQSRKFNSTAGEDLLKDITYSCYPTFGIAVFKSPQLYLSIGFGSSRKSHRSWGHQHNDKLSIEIQLNGKDVLVNNGTYLYTPLPERRNQFRSTFSKNVAYVPGEEQNWWKEGKPGLFNLIKQCKAEVLILNKQEVAIMLTYRKIVQIRHILISKEGIDVIDYANAPITQHWCEKKPISNGYGKLKKA